MASGFSIELLIELFFIELVRSKGPQLQLHYSSNEFFHCCLLLLTH
jgi:hypothetical protein